VVRAEEEKLKLDELIKKDKGKIKVLRILARLFLRVAHKAVCLASAGVDRALDMHAPIPAHHRWALCLRLRRPDQASDHIYVSTFAPSVDEYHPPKIVEATTR
jgi:hypothetical protein